MTYSIAHRGTAYELHCALDSSVVLLKGKHLLSSSMCLAAVVPASIEKGAAVCPDLKVCEGIVLRYVEIFLWDAGECPGVFLPAPDLGLTVVELR